MLFLTKPGTSGQRSKKKKENPNKLQEKKKFCVYNSFSLDTPRTGRGAQKKKPQTHNKVEKKTIFLANPKRTQQNEEELPKKGKNAQKLPKIDENRPKSAKTPDA